jgi:DNA-binding GntR family transcriptional regulator
MDVRLADWISESLEELVFTGAYKDGERLDEIKLAEHFKVSRTPVREALQRLVMSGMAEQIPRRGVFVRQPGPVELLEMFETMAELEAACGRLAASRISEEGIARLRDADLRCQMAVEAKDIATYYAENETFHREIYRGAANGYLEKEALRLQNRLKPYRRVQLRFRGRMEQSLAEHRRILDTLEAGDGEAASTALRGHVAVQGEKFHQLMASLQT